jgi:hypothetical protein
LFPSQKSQNHQSTPCISWCILMPAWPLGWTMTKSQSLKVEKWWSLIRPRTECELFVFVSGFHFAVFHWISIDPSLVYFWVLGISAGIDEEGIEVPITCQRGWGDVRSFELQQFAQHFRMDSVILTFCDR